MPELPDVEIRRRYLAATSLHQAVGEVSVSDDRILEDTTPQALGRALNGHAFVAARRHGKYLFAETDGPNALVLHFAMSGELAYYREGGETPDYARLTVHFEDGGRLAYVSRRMLGKVSVTRDVAAYLATAGVGPDALDEALTRDRFRELVADSRAMAKATLMSQDRVAGVGNVYADEILYQAGVYPKVRMATLETEGVDGCYGAMRHVLEVAIAHDADPARLPDDFLLPHRHEEGRCPSCGRALLTGQVSGRTTYWCGACQGTDRSA